MENTNQTFKKDITKAISSLTFEQRVSKDNRPYKCIVLTLKNGWSKMNFLNSDSEFAIRDAVSFLETEGIMDNSNSLLS